MNTNIQNFGIADSTSLILAISGGSDSICLLNVFVAAGFKKIVVAHLDHQIRPDSHKDAELVKKAAEKFGCKFELKKLNIKKLAGSKKENLEAVGRDERYKFFREIKKKYKAAYIVTAHHADDQIETVLLNIIRGSGLEGLSGMSVIENDLWRPLLPYSKKEIENYCREKKLKFIKESTNEDTEYRRNYLRLKVIPLLKELNPNLTKTMEKNIQIWGAAAGYFEQEAREVLEQIRIGVNRFDLKKFLDLNELLQSFVLRMIFEDVHGHKKNLAQEHLEQVLKIIRTNISGKKKEFGAGKVLVKQKTFFEII